MGGRGGGGEGVVVLCVVFIVVVVDVVDDDRIISERKKTWNSRSCQKLWFLVTILIWSTIMFSQICVCWLLFSNFMGGWLAVLKFVVVRDALGHTSRESTRKNGWKLAFRFLRKFQQKIVFFFKRTMSIRIFLGEKIKCWTNLEIHTLFCERNILSVKSKVIFGKNVVLREMQHTVPRFEEIKCC